jgi:TRAP-type C4-dicarboxylate transport system substrate-binding protein
MKMRDFVRTAAAAVVAVSATASASQYAAAQQPVVMKFGTQTQNEIQHEYIKAFKANLEKATNNRIRVDLYPASQLGPFPRQIEGVRLGNIEAVIAPFEFYVGVDPSFQITSMTGLFKDNANMRKVADNPAFRQILTELGEKRGVTVGAFVVYDMQTFAFKAPASTLADFKGRRLRVLASEVEQAAVQALGAASIPMALPEVLPGLQQGTVDGLNGGITNYVSLRYFDASPYMIDTRLWGFLSGALMSKDWLDKLPADLKKAVLDTAKATEHENFEWQVARVESDRKTWVERGGKIANLSEADQAEAQKRVTQATETVLAKHPAIKANYEKAKAIASAIK